MSLYLGVYFCHEGGGGKKHWYNIMNYKTGDTQGTIQHTSGIQNKQDHGPTYI
jgi:hypothetical protein